MANNNSWNDYFDSLPGDDEGNKNMAIFSEFCSNTKASASSKLRDLVEDADTVFLGAYNGKVIVLHSPTNFGGTRTRKSNKLACLTGLGPEAIGVLLNEESILSSKKFKGADEDKAIDCTTKEEIDNLKNTTQYTLGAIFIPAPFLRTAILNLDSRDPREMIYAAGKATDIFEVEEVQDEEFNMKYAAEKHVRKFATWLHGIILKQMTDVKYEVAPDDSELSGYVKQRQTKCIIPSLVMAAQNTNPADNEGVTRQLNASLTAHTEAARESNKLRREEINRLKEKDEKEKDKASTRIHKSVIHMLKMASSEDGERATKDMSEGCKAFLNCTSAGMAEIELSEQLESLKVRNTSFAHGTVIALYGGLYLYSTGGSPSNLSAFCFTKGRALQTNTNERALVLHLVHQQGKGKSLEELKTSAKQTVAVPTDIIGLDTQLKIFNGVLKVFLGPNNPVSHGIKSFLRDLEENSIEFESLSEADISIPAKILYGIDTRIQRFLVQCKRTYDREDVNERLVDFSDITDSCLNQSFSMSLPPVFQFSRLTKPDDQSRHIMLRGPEQKRQKQGEQEEFKPRRCNSDKDGDFKIKDNENWKDNWAGKLNREKPYWDKNKTNFGDCKMCTKFHIKGWCFDDCIYAESHAPHDKIPVDRKAAMKEYMKKVRRN